MSGPTQAPAVRAVGAVVVDRTGRVLLVRRRRPPGRGDWSLPGGRLEAGETVEAAVVREVFEETAVHARVVCPLGIVRLEREDFVYAIEEFLLTPDDDAREPVGGDDASDAGWFDRSEVGGLGLRADAIAVVDAGLDEARARQWITADTSAGSA